MDAKEVLAAITGQDEGKALEILTGWVAEQINAATGGGASPGEPDGDEPPGDPMAKTQPPKPGADPLAAPPPADGAARARIAAIDAELVRARAARVEHEAILADSRKGAVDSLITSLRARLPAGHKGLAATEKDILAAPNYQTAKQIHDLAVRFAPEEDAAARARSGDRLTASPSLAEKKAIVKPDDLGKFDPGFQAFWNAVAENEGQEAADKVMANARARLARDAQQGRA